VAIVEDDPESLAVLCKQLESDFRPIAFQGGTSVLRNATHLAEFDALVLDWRLPDITGAELVRQVRANTAAPIIVITGELREGHAIAEILRLPDISYLTKPVDEEILRALLTSLINRAPTKAP